MFGRFVEADHCAWAAATKAMSATEAATAGKRFFRFKFILSLSKLRPSARKNCAWYAAGLETGHHLLQLPGCDANGTIHWDAGTGEERAEQVALVAFGISQKSSRVDRTTALARDDEGKVFAGVLVPVLKARAPHHDAVIKEGAVSFAQAVHLLHHVCELSNVEGGNCLDLANLLGFVVVMGLGVVLIAEPEFRIRNTVRCRANVRADASRVGLERQHVQVTHHLHVLAAFITLRNLNLNRWRIRSIAFAHADSSLLQRGLFLAKFNGSNAAFNGAHAVQVFVQFLLIVP